MKPFATLGSEISKVRDRVRRGAEALRPTKVASDVRDQRDRLLAKLGEQTFRLIAERKLQVPKVLQDSVEKLATLLGVQLPSSAPDGSAEAIETNESKGAADHESIAASYPIDSEGESAGVLPARRPIDEPAEVDEPSLGDISEVSPPPPRVRTAPPIRETPAKPAGSAKKKPTAQKKSSKRRNKR